MSGRDSGGLVSILLIVSLAAGVGVLLSGCKAEEAKSTGFTTADIMDKDPNLPFHKVWRKPGLDWKSYHKIYVAPVNTEYMLKTTDWQKDDRKEQIEKDVNDLATFTKETIEQQFREDPSHHFQVLDAPTTDPDALEVQAAITEIVPSKVVLNALGYAPFGIGLTISAVRKIASDESSAAFEARVVDSSTHEVIAMAADRESEQFSPISVRGLTWYSHAKTMIQQWAKQFVQIASRKPGETVKDTETFTLKPW